MNTIRESLFRMERSDDSISPLIGNEHFVGNKRGRYWKLRVGCLVVVLFFAGFCRGLLKSDEDSVIDEEPLNESIIIDTSTKEHKIIKDPNRPAKNRPKLTKINIYQNRLKSTEIDRNRPKLTKSDSDR